MSRQIRIPRRVLFRCASIGGSALFTLALVGCSGGDTSGARAPATQAAPTARSEVPSPGASNTPPAPEAKATAAQPAKPATKIADIRAMEESAKREGRVTFYGGVNPQAQANLIAAFQKRYPIRMDGVRLATGPLSQRYAAEAEADNVVADVIQVNDPVFFEQAAQKKWITRFDDLPALETWPTAYWYGFWATLDVSLYNVVFNTDLVKPEEVPKTWTDLADPRWKGKLFFIDPRNTPAVLALLYLFRELYGADFLRRLAGQDLRLVASGVPGSQQLAAGAAHLLFPANHDIVVQLQKDGAPVDDRPVEPSTGSEQLVGVSTKAPHPNAARLLLNFLLSPEGQAVLVEDGYQSVRPDVPGAKPLPKSYRSPKVREALASQKELLELTGIQ